MFKGEEGQREERILAYYSYLNQARVKNIVALEETTKELQEQKELEQKTSRTKTTLARQQQEKRKLDNARFAAKP